jgi:hypothetical protein
VRVDFPTFKETHMDETPFINGRNAIDIPRSQLYLHFENKKISRRKYYNLASGVRSFIKLLFRINEESTRD